MTATMKTIGLRPFFLLSSLLCFSTTTTVDAIIVPLGRRYHHHHSSAIMSSPPSSLSVMKSMRGGASTSNKHITTLNVSNGGSSFLRDALRIDMSSSIIIKDRLAELTTSSSKTSEDKPLIPGCSVTSGHIESMYNESDEKASKVVLVLKICLGMIQCGHATVDVEDHAMRVSKAIGLDAPRFDIGPKSMTASFGDGPVHLLETNRGIMLSKLGDITDLAILLEMGGRNENNSILAATTLVDEIIEAPSSYGWLVQDIGFWLLCTMASVCAFFGSPTVEGPIVGGISFAIVILQHLIKKFPGTLQKVETLLVATLVGALSSAGWKYILAAKLASSSQLPADYLCRVSILFLSPLLTYLPGSELVYGTYEVVMGQSVVGGSRLVSSMVKCMWLAFGLLLGWQTFGHNFMAASDLASNVAQASYVPCSSCIPFSLDGTGPWLKVFGGYNLILLFGCLSGLGTRPRDFLGPYIISYISLLFFGGINFAWNSSWGLPSFLINALGLFVATNLACLREYFTNIPAISAIIPTLLILAPGSTAVLDILKLMQGVEGINIGGVGDVFTSLVLLGASYTFGLFSAYSIWKPILQRKQSNLAVQRNKQKQG